MAVELNPCVADAPPRLNLWPGLAIHAACLNDEFDIRDRFTKIYGI
jgi:hypothetical protein